MAKTLSVPKDSIIGKQIQASNLPNFDKTGSIEGMKKQYYGKDALLVRVGNYIYNCTDKPELYNEAEQLKKTIAL